MIFAENFPYDPLHIFYVGNSTIDTLHFIIERNDSLYFTCQTFHNFFGYIDTLIYNYKINSLYYSHSAMGLCCHYGYIETTLASP